MLGAVVVLRAIWPMGEARTLVARLSAAGALMLPAALSAAAWFWSFYAIYGTFDPRAPYGHATDMRLARIPHGLAGLFFDQQFGLLPNAPIYLIALLGLGALWRRNRRLTCELIAISTPYLLAVAGFHMWWGGRSSPARFLVPVLLPFAIPIAAWWASHSTRAARASALALLGVTLGITAALVLVDRGALVYNTRDGHSLWLLAAATAVNLTYALPSLFQAAPASASVTGVAWLAALAGGGVLLRWLDGRGVADGVFRAATIATAALVCSDRRHIGVVDLRTSSGRPRRWHHRRAVARLRPQCDRRADLALQGDVLVVALPRGDRSPTRRGVLAETSLSGRRQTSRPAATTSGSTRASTSPDARPSHSVDPTRQSRPVISTIGRLRRPPARCGCRPAPLRCSLMATNVYAARLPASRSSSTAQNPARRARHTRCEPSAPAV